MKKNIVKTTCYVSRGTLSADAKTARNSPNADGWTTTREI